MKISSPKGKYHTPMELLDFFAENNLSNNFCIVPFTNIILNPSGDVSICRQKGTEHKVGNLSNNTIEEIWNNDYMINWRHEFLSGDVKICSDNIKRDQCHLSLDNYTLAPFLDLSEKQEGPILKLTANFNGKCNLRCRMCDIWMMENGYYDNIDFWDKAQENFFPYIKEIELLSGEPFIQSDTFRLIKIISEINPDVLWSFTTNGHWKLNKAITQSLDKIKIKNIIYSVDSFNPDDYKRIRIDGNLNVVLKNIKEMAQYNKERKSNGLGDMGLNLHYLVMKDNWQELSKAIDFADTNQMKTTFNNCQFPEAYSFNSLSDKEASTICSQIISNNSYSHLKRLSSVIFSLTQDLEPVSQAFCLDLYKQRLKSR